MKVLDGSVAPGGVYECVGKNASWVALGVNARAVDSYGIGYLDQSFCHIRICKGSKLGDLESLGVSKHCINASSHHAAIGLPSVTRLDSKFPRLGAALQARWRGWFPRCCSAAVAHGRSRVSSTRTTSRSERRCGAVHSKRSFRRCPAFAPCSVCVCEVESGSSSKISTN